MITVKFYVCAKQGKTTDAVAVCAECGMAVCSQRAVELDGLASENQAGYLTPKTMRILCAQDAKTPKVTA